MTKKLKNVIEDKITHTTEKGDKKAATMSGGKTVNARCVGYDRDRRIVVVINPFGKQGSLNKSGDAISDVTRQLIIDYGLTNLVEIPWTPQSGNDSEVDPGEALEGSAMAGVKEMDEEITYHDMFSYLFYLKMQKELTLKEWMTSLRMIDDALGEAEEDNDKPPKLNEIVVEIQFTQLTWPQKAKCIRVVTFDPTEQGEHVAASVPKGSDALDTSPEESMPHDKVNLDRVVEDVDRLLEKVGSESNNTSTTDRTLVDEILRRRDEGFSPDLPAVSSADILAQGGQQGGVPVGGGEAGASSPTPGFGGAAGSSASSEMTANAGTVNANIYEGDEAPIYKPESTVNGVNSFNIAKPNDPTSWGSKTDPQEPMLTMLNRYGLLRKRDRTIITSTMSEKVVKDLVLMNPIRNLDYVATLAGFGVSTLSAVGSEINSPGLMLRVGQNAPVVASAAGVVIDIINEGNGLSTVVIKHNEDIFTEYSGLLNESIAVIVNQWVNGGKIIGLVAPAVTNVSVLTFVVKDGGAPKDPLNYIPGWRT